MYMVNRFPYIIDFFGIIVRHAKVAAFEVSHVPSDVLFLLEERLRLNLQLLASKRSISRLVIL